MGDYASNQAPQIEEMLKTIGIASIDELYQSIPSQLRQEKPPIDDGMSEAEVAKYFEKLSEQNSFVRLDSYLGGGAYAHYIPAIVQTVISRSEFLTSYTPYQPEASQGMLQAIFEFQTMIATLTKMDVANAGVYDGASACAEAALMALRIKKERSKIYVSKSFHPLYLRVLKTYLNPNLSEVVIVENETDPQFDEKTAAALVQSPNFFGQLESIELWKSAANKVGALLITCGNPLSYALLKPPGEYGADIAVGDCQPLGLPLNFGGPYAGFMACKSEYLRQLPGRIVGATHDLEGKKGFVLTLQTREQHIRREKATSNICTNQALATLATLVSTVWYGPIGLKKLALSNYQRAHYLSRGLSQISGFAIKNPFFNEFTLKIPVPMTRYLTHFRTHGIEPGIPLNRFYPEMDQHLLVAVTELKTIDQLNYYLEVAKGL